MRESLFILSFLLASSMTLLAQQIQITGVVTDDFDNAPLFGVRVSIKNTQTTSFTDLEGKYAIMANKSDILVFSYVGTETQEKTVGNANVINVVLNSKTELQDVVVIGYGSVRKSDLTGAVGSMKTDEVLKTNPASINQALQGRIAGVNVMQTDGAPGSSISIQIRGANSFSSNVEPLFVIDGVPYESTSSSTGGRTVNPLAFINAQDIESLEVLKDASATAIYGSRGANGVVLVTTKRGKKGMDRIEVGANFTTSYLNNRVKFLDGHDYATYTNERQRNHYVYDGVEYYAPEYSGQWGYDRTKGYYVYNPSPQDFRDGYMNGGTDWTDVITQQALSQEYTVSYSGANDRGDHYISGSLFDQKGVIYGTGYKRATLRMNINRQIRDNIRAGTIMTFANSKTEWAVADWASADVFRDALYYPSTESIFDPVTMDVNDEDFYYATNPYVSVRQQNDNTTGKNMHLNAYVSIDFLKSLQVKQTLGYGYNYSERLAYWGQNTRAGHYVGGIGTQADYWNTNISSETLLTFNKTLFDNHRINAVGAYTFEEFNYGNKGLSGEGFPDDYKTMYDMDAAMSDRKSIWSGRGRYRIFSYLARLNYVFKDKYLFTASARADGSSKFAPGNKWADFYSFALAWRASEEPFIKNLNIFSNLKPRISFGETGNQSIANYQTRELFIDSNAVFGGVVKPGYAEAVWKGPVNLDLVWETTAQYNLGLDMGFFNNKLSVTADAYYKKTRDLLQDRIIPSSSGFGKMKSNYGFVINKGLELTIQGMILDKTPLKWDVNANIYLNRNEIGGLDGDQFAERLFVSVDNVFMFRNRRPIGTIWGYISDGFYENEAAVRADPIHAKKTYQEVIALIGEERIKNIDDNPTSISLTDKTIIGNVNPDFQFGITNNFSWKNFSFSFFIQGNIGGDIINANLLQNVSLTNWGNIPKFVFDGRWTTSNAYTAEFPKPNNGFGRTTLFSDRFIEDATYVRLKNINIGYNISNPIKHLANIYIYANASNILTFTGYRWFDPDVNSFGGDVTRRGVDMSAYPTATTVSGGIKLSF